MKRTYYPVVNLDSGTVLKGLTKTPCLYADALKVRSVAEEIKRLTTTLDYKRPCFGLFFKEHYAADTMVCVGGIEDQYSIKGAFPRWLTYFKIDDIDNAEKINASILGLFDDYQKLRFTKNDLLSSLSDSDLTEKIHLLLEQNKSILVDGIPKGDFQQYFLFVFGDLDDTVDVSDKVSQGFHMAAFANAPDEITDEDTIDVEVGSVYGVVKAFRFTLETVPDDAKFITFTVYPHMLGSLIFNSAKKQYTGTYTFTIPLTGTNQEKQNKIHSALIGVNNAHYLPRYQNFEDCCYRSTFKREFANYLYTQRYYTDRSTIDDILVLQTDYIRFSFSQ